MDLKLTGTGWESRRKGK